MPTVREQRATGYAWCEDPMCDGTAQQPVEVVVHTTHYTYADSGGDLPGVEKSFNHYLFAEEHDRACPTCGKSRAVGVQQRPVYPTSQWAQDGLLKLIRDGMVKPMGELSAQRDSEIAELKAQIAELRSLLTEKPRRGRPPAEPKGEET